MRSKGLEILKQRRPEVGGTSVWEEWKKQGVVVRESQGKEKLQTEENNSNLSLKYNYIYFPLYLVCS